MKTDRTACAGDKDCPKHSTLFATPCSFASEKACVGSEYPIPDDVLVVLELNWPASERWEATILMVDGNSQRENLLPPERALTYQMELEAIKQQGQ